MFVDYKTSADLRNTDWLEPRPKAPQLPLYALLEDPEKVQGIAFGRVRAGEAMHWISLSTEKGIFPTKGNHLTDLTGLMVEWRNELDRLATAFAEGNADVDPKIYPGTCRFCDQRLLCRLDPASLLATEPAEEEEEDSGG